MHTELVNEKYTLKTIIGEWNIDKSLSDHKGVFVDFERNALFVN